MLSYIYFEYYDEYILFIIYAIYTLYILLYKYTCIGRPTFIKINAKQLVYTKKKNKKLNRYHFIFL